MPGPGPLRGWTGTLPGRELIALSPLLTKLPVGRLVSVGGWSSALTNPSCEVEHA